MDNVLQACVRQLRWCMLVVVLTLLLTLISGGVWGLVACRSPRFHIFYCAQLDTGWSIAARWPWWHWKKNGRGQQHFHFRGTSSCWLCIDTEISPSSTSAPTYCNAELSRFYWKPYKHSNIQWHTCVQPTLLHLLAAYVNWQGHRWCTL